MEALESLVFWICATTPLHFLAYYPFWNILRFPKKAVIALVSVSLVVKQALIYLAVSHGIDAYWVEYLFAPIHLAIYLVNIRMHPYKLVFTYLLLMDYNMIVKGVSAFVIVFFLNGVPGSWLDAMVCAILYAVSLPIMVLFFKSAIQRVYRISAPIWNTIWIVPAFTSFVVLLFTGDFAVDKILRWPFLFTRVSLLACIFVVYHILLQSLASFEQQTILEAQKLQSERLLSLQREQYALLKSQNEETRRFRHDLRQQLVAARHYLEENQTEKLQNYLDTLLGELPMGTASLCPNDAVNAVVLYHCSAAEKAGIDVKLQLEAVPETCPQELESDLCVLIGNLLENAIAGCKNTSQPFVTMRTRFADGILTIAMDNRFAQVERTEEGEFLSTKPGGGIGLRSIAAIAEKYQGGSRFETKGTVFSSSVYLRVTPCV